MEATVHIKVVSSHGNTPPISLCGEQSWVLLTDKPGLPATCQRCLEAVKLTAKKGDHKP